MLSEAIFGSIQGIACSGILRLRGEFVALDQPFLLPRESLFRMDSDVSFRIPNVVLKSKIAAHVSFAPIGHLAFLWKPVDSPSVGSSPATSCDVSSLDIDLDSCMISDQITKMRQKFGHADTATIVRICHISKKKINEGCVKRVAHSCSCLTPSGPGERPVVSKYVSNYPGETAVIDTCYPHPINAQRRPAFLAVDDLAEFLCCRFIPNLRPPSYSHVLLNRWIPPRGAPQGHLV